VPAEQVDERRRLLAQALLHARAVKEADHRVIHLGWVAEQLLSLGDKDQATKIIQEGRDGAKNLPTAGWSGYARAAFATSLSVFDLPGALEMIKDLKDAHEYDRHHGNIAHKLAAKNPAEAERILNLMREQWRRDQSAVGVCYRMAPFELDRARSIAERVKNVQYRAEAYGAMAQALAKTNKAQATQLLRKAFAVLADQVATGGENYNNFRGSSSLAAMLLPVAEQIDPALVPEFFWRAVSYRIPRLGETPLESIQPTKAFADAALAYALARYDRAIAERLLDEATPPLLGALSNGANHLFQALALINPRKADQLLERLTVEPRRDYLREMVAERLLLEGEALWRRVHRDMATGWLDDEDL